MGRSRRKYQRSRTKVKVGLPKKHPNVFKPAFTLPPKLRSLMEESTHSQWDSEASVIQNYKQFGVVSNPNLLNVRSRNSKVVQSESLQLPNRDADVTDADLDPGSDLEEDDLKSAMGKKRRDGKTAPLQPLTTIQRKHIQQLIEKYGDEYQRMFMDAKLNSMQHSVATLEKLCKRYHIYKDKNPLLVVR